VSHDTRVTRVDKMVGTYTKTPVGKERRVASIVLLLPLMYNGSNPNGSNPNGGTQSPCILHILSNVRRQLRGMTRNTLIEQITRPSAWSHTFVIHPRRLVTVMEKGLLAHCPP
jgi:hypothetical protein